MYDRPAQDITSIMLVFLNEGRLERRRGLGERRTLSTNVGEDGGVDFVADGAQWCTPPVWRLGG